MVTRMFKMLEQDKGTCTTCVLTGSFAMDSLTTWAHASPACQAVHLDSYLSANMCCMIFSPALVICVIQVSIWHYAIAAHL